MTVEAELEQFISRARAEGRSSVYGVVEPDLEADKALMSFGPEQRARLAILVVSQLEECENILRKCSSISSTNPDWRVAHELNSLLGKLLRSKLPFSEEDVARLLQFGARRDRIPWMQAHTASLLRVAECFSEQQALSPSHLESLKAMRETRVAFSKKTAEGRKLAERVNALINGRRETISIQLDKGEPWTDRALSDLSQMQEAGCEAWHVLLNHARSATGSKPSKVWLKHCRELIQAIGNVEISRRIADWFSLVGKPGVGRPMRGYVGEVLDPTIISEPNADVLKGLAWAAGAAGESSLSRALADLAEVCFKKLPVHGARCPRVGNACLAALNLLPGNEPVGELTRLRGRVKQPSLRGAVEKAIDRSASALGVSRDEVEEMSTPTYGLAPDGKLTRPLGPYTGELAIVGTCDVALTWRGSTGKTVKSVPAEVKRNYSAELKELQRIQKDLQKMLPAQAQRVERLLVERRQWPLDIWRQRYLDHPLLGQISRRLIWQFLGAASGQTAIYHDGKLVTVDGTSCQPPSDVLVRLWHPIDSPAEVVLAWRQWLEKNQVTQPFKQAHREVYILTDAERQTVTYSNRFAAHVLRQHQFHALCQARGWKYCLMGGFDSHNTPTLELPRHEMLVEFWVDQPPNDELSPAGINLRIVTDQVRFCRRGDREPMALEQVDAIVFSECMRDVDLFVGVCSVGNDPGWQDGGPDGRFQNYWRDFSFGKLSETAETRRAVLESLLPRLTKIRERCSLAERFLVVRGDLRTYKIHLGSGNILMEPNDQYLCIVPSRGKEDGGGVFLPFEGDATLSIILSKAFLLAEDKKIKDETITRQIGGG